MRARGQLLLIGGLALAVVLVAVALVMNAAIYTENLASRDDADRVDEVGTIESDLRRTAGELLSHERAANYDDYAAQDAALADAVAGMEKSVLYYGAQDGASAVVGYDSATEGAMIRQSNQGKFDDFDGGETTWTLVSNSKVRQFEMTVDGDTLATIPAGAGATVSDLETEAVFNVELEQGDDTRQVYLFRDDTDDLIVTVRDASDNNAGSCVVSGGGARDVTISFADATVDDRHCEPLETALGDSSTYTIRYDDVLTGEGTYSLIVGEDEGMLDSSSHYDDTDDTNPSDPYVVEAVYSAKVTLTVDTPELRYETTLRVAPGENDG